MGKICPEPMEPGCIALKDWVEEDWYISRWAGWGQVVEAVKKGDYKALTPIASEMIPSLYCPYACPMCAYRIPKVQAGAWNAKELRRSDGIVEMKPEEAVHYIDKLADGGCRCILLTGGGEPTFYEHLAVICDAAKRRGLQLAITTNGTFLGDLEPEAVVEYDFRKVRISLNSIENHRTFHGYGPDENYLDLVLDNIERIKVAKSKRSSVDLELVICIVVDGRNVGELSSIAKWIAFSSGADTVVIRPVIRYFDKENPVEKGFMQKLSDEIDRCFAPVLEAKGIKVIRPENRFGRDGFFGARNYRRCTAAGLIGNLWSSGEMFICTETNGHPDFKIGSLKESTLSEIYGGERYRLVLERIEKERFECCPATCRPDLLNKLFDQVESRRAHSRSHVIHWIGALEEMHTNDANPFIMI